MFFISSLYSQIFSHLSVNWLRAAVAAHAPADTILEIVSRLNLVDSGRTRNLCETWLRLALKLLLGRLQTEEVHSSSTAMSDSLPALSDCQYPIELLQSALTAMRDMNIDIPRSLFDSLQPSLMAARLFLPALHIVHANLTNIGALPGDNEAQDEMREGAFLPTSTSYIGVLQCQSQSARFGSPSLADDTNSTSFGRSSDPPSERAESLLPTSGSTNRLNFGRFSSEQTVFAESSSSTSCGTSPVSSFQSTQQQLVFGESPPSVADDMHISNFDQISQPESELAELLPPSSGRPNSTSAESSSLHRADAARVGYLQSITSRVAQQVSFSNNGGFISAMYQISEAASLRLTPQPVRDALIESARAALNLPRLEFGPGARDSIESVGVWSINVLSSFAGQSDAVRELYFHNMLYAFEAMHSDKNAILACLHRFRMWASFHVGTSEARKICRNILLRMIIRRNLLNSAWGCMDVESPDSMFSVPALRSDIRAHASSIRKSGSDIGMANLLISAFRFRGEYSRAIALFSVLVDKLSNNISLYHLEQESDSNSRTCFFDIQIAAIALLSGGSPRFALRTIPRVVIEFMTRWANVVEHGAESVLDQVALSGIDVDVYDRALASAAILHVNAKSNVFLHELINNLRSKFQVQLLELTVSFTHNYQ